jgi:hypothetical protein
LSGALAGRCEGCLAVLEGDPHCFADEADEGYFADLRKMKLNLVETQFLKEFSRDTILKETNLRQFLHQCGHQILIINASLILLILTILVLLGLSLNNNSSIRWAQIQNNLSKHLIPPLHIDQGNLDIQNGDNWTMIALLQLSPAIINQVPEIPC